MRTKLLAGAAGLLAATPAFAQPATPPAALAGSPPYGVSADPALTTSVAEATAGDPWGTTGPRAWASADYLLWWVKPMKTPTLIQTVPSAQALPGATIPAGATRPFFPENRRIDFGALSGVRGTVGMNFDRFGLEASGFVLEEGTRSSSLFSPGRPFAVAESYVNAAGGQPSNLFASLPDQYVGGVSVSADTRLWGADANARLPFYAFLTNSTDLLTGFRYLNLEEELHVRFQSSFPSGVNGEIRDDIHTRNQFYGGQVGLNGRIGGMERGLGLDVTPKLALGGVHQRVDLAGSNTFTAPGFPADTEAGGLYARGANRGTFSRDRFAAVLSLDANLTYNFTRATQVYVGYSIVFISDVVRPGDQIDQTVNESRTRFIADPSPSAANRPAFRWDSTGYTAQGITFGARFQY